MAVPPPRHEAPTSPSPKIESAQVIGGEGPEFKYEITEIQKQVPLPSERNALLVEGTDLESGSASEKWTIFAWAVRDVLSKASGLPLSE